MKNAGLLVLICGGLLSVVLVAMLYGDRFSLVGLFDGRWMSPITQLISNAWVELLLGVDRTVSFVAEHLAWVIAAVSGTVGLSLIAFLMFTGLAEDAAALNRDAATALNAGGVLDQIPDLGDPHIPGATPQLVSLLGHEHRLLQSELGGRGTFAPALPRIEDRIATPGGTESDNWPFENFPGPVRVAEPILSLDLRRLSAATLPPLDEEASVLSRVTNDIPDPRMIDIAVRRLGADDWTRGTGNVNWRGRVLTDRDAIRESTPYEVIDLERGVRIIPGDDVNEQDLRIEKVVPRESAGSQLTVSIHISNEGRDSIRGLLVREYLPIGTTVVDALPGGTYRDDILTWLIDELRPFEEVTLQFTVLADGQTRFRGPVTFGSQTEVSAATAVQSQIEVIDRRQPSRRPELPPPTPAGTVKLTMTISEPLEQPRENEWTEYDFEITNEGTATAENVQVNLNIDLGLRHHRITEDDIERELASGSFSLAPNQTRTLPLRVKPMSRGRYFCTAELLHNGAQVELRSLEFTALRAPEVPATDSPE